MQVSTGFITWRSKLAGVAQTHTTHSPNPPGMDTRPWRLPLPPNVSWFEVDRADVLAAKTATLGRAGVQLRGRSQMDQLQALMPHTFNLNAARWSSAACDLQVGLAMHPARSIQLVNHTQQPW